MKKISLIFALCILLTSLNAQRLGVKLGLNLADGKYEITQTGISTSSLAGVQAGLIFETPIDQALYFNTGLLYSMKGSKLSIMGVEVKWPITYLEVPLNVCYKYALQNSKIFFQAGPYMGIGLSAKMKAGGDDRTIDFGSDIDQMKQLDFGLNFGGGIEIKNIQLGLGYGLGLTNLSNDPDETLKNGVFSISVGFFFKE